MKKIGHQENIKLRFRVSEEPAVSTNLEKCLTERYCLRTKPSYQLLRVDIAHKPWKLKYVQGNIMENHMAPFLGNNFRYEKPVAHASKMPKVRFYLPVVES